MKNVGVIVSENFQFLEVKFSIYFNRSVFIMALLCRKPIQEVTNFVSFFKNGGKSTKCIKPF